jgi:hypothetical protein
MLERPVTKPQGVSSLPDRASVSAAVSQQEPLNALPACLTSFAGDLASADQIAHGLVRAVGDPDFCQLACPRQSSQHDRVAPVGLYAVASTMMFEKPIPTSVSACVRAICDGACLGAFRSGLAIRSCFSSSTSSAACQKKR